MAIVAVFFIALTFQSCGSEKKETVLVAKPAIPQLYYAGTDTSVSWDTYSLRNFFRKDGCGKTVAGQYLAKDPVRAGTNLTLQGRPVPTDSIEKWFGTGAVPIKNPGFIPDGEELSGRDQNFDAQKADFTAWDFSWLGYIAQVIGFLILLLGGAWVLWWLLRNWPSRTVTPSTIVSTDTKGSAAKSPSTGFSGNRADVLTILSQLQETGGEYREYEDGGLEIKIPLQQKNIDAPAASPADQKPANEASTSEGKLD